MDEFDTNHENYSGSLLVAHPGLRDPNFRKAIVLLSAHTEEEGALGVIINKPTAQCLGDLEEKFEFSALAEVPIYIGGPVANDQILLCAWTWSEEMSTFKLFFGIDPERASELVEVQGATVRAFQGYSGWSSEQLEFEIEHDSWIVSRIKTTIIDGLDEDDLWLEYMRDFGPKFSLEANAPDDPSVN